MPDPELIKYVIQQRKKGKNDFEIVNLLKEMGWDENVINTTLEASEVPLPPNIDKDISTNDPSPEIKTTYNHTLWDTFQHILMFVTMSVYAFSLNMLHHALIDKYFSVKSRTLLGTIGDLYVTGLISAIIVSFPLFLFFFIRIKKRNPQEP
jgi:hypothetical protein